MPRNDRSFATYIKEDGFAPTSAGAGPMGVAGTDSSVKLDLPMGSSKPDAPEYKKKNKTTLLKLKAVIK